MQYTPYQPFFHQPYHIQSDNPGSPSLLLYNYVQPASLRNPPRRRTYSSERPEQTHCVSRSSSFSSRASSHLARERSRLEQQPWYLEKKEEHARNRQRLDNILRQKSLINDRIKQNQYAFRNDPPRHRRRLSRRGGRRNLRLRDPERVEESHGGEGSRNNGREQGFIYDERCVQSGQAAIACVGTRMLTVTRQTPSAASQAQTRRTSKICKPVLETPLVAYFKILWESRRAMYELPSNLTFFEHFADMLCRLEMT